MNALYALYPDGHSAQRAVNGLRAAGVSDDDITVISAQPMEEFDFSRIGHGTYMWYLACAGGLVGLTFATWLTRLTETSWIISTGGMPIVPWWPNLITMFELTMLGAILASAVTLIVTARLGRRRPVLYDPAVTDGKILVGVENPREGSIADLQRALQINPGVSIKTI